MRRRSFTDVETLTGDLRAFVIGVIAGVISGVVAFYLTKVIDRYWALRSIKSLRRRMEYAEAQKARLDELMKSDRALLLMAFRALFGLLGIIAVALTGQELLLFVRERFTISPEQLVSFTAWFAVAVAAFYFAHLFKQVAEYSTSVEKIDKTISEIKRKLPTEDS
jgi:hypothetical protein